MSILICKNTSEEGPGTIKDFLEANNTPYTIIEMFKNEEIPDINKFKTLIILGSHISVNDDKKHSFIKQEMDLIEKFMSEDKPILGICLGAQMIAKVLGEKVYKGNECEQGWHSIELTADGIRDPLMLKLSVHPRAGDFWRKYKVFQWHEETFDLPTKALNLAKSGLYPNQAFKYRKKAYGLQFHIEMTKEMIYDWMKTAPYDPEKARIDTEKLFEIYQARANNFYRAFFSL